MPVHGKGQEVPHELAIQVALAALRQYVECLSWRTSRMPGGRWDVGMIHGEAAGSCVAPTCFPASTTTRAASDWAPAPPWSRTSP